MIDPQNMNQRVNDLVEKRIRESQYTTLFDLRNIFPIVTLDELKSMQRDKKISFLFKVDDSTLKKFATKKSLRLTNSLTIIMGLFMIAAIVFSIYYSIKYSEYILLTALPLIFISLSTTSPYKKIRNPALVLAIILIVVCFFITSETLIILIVIFSLTNILSNLVRKVNQINMTNLILNNELAFVQGYVNNSFSLKNQINKSILMNVLPAGLQKQLLRDFENDLRV